MPYLKSQNADVILLQEDSGREYHFEGYQKANPEVGVTVLTQHKIIGYKIIDPHDESVRIPGLQVDIEIRGKVYRFIDVYLHPFQFDKDMVRLNRNTDDNERKVKGVVKRLIPTFKNIRNRLV